MTAPGVVIAERFGAHHVEIAFKPRGGKLLTYMQGGDVMLHTGERVVVRYDPRDPRLDPCVDRWAGIWGDTIFLTAIGRVFTAMASLLLVTRFANEGERKFLGGGTSGT